MTSFLAVLLPAMAAAVLGGATPAAAWGHDGHWLTAALADSLLTETASAAMYSILGEADNLTTVSSWPDSVVHSAEWKWSAPLHYVNPKVGTCTVVMERDCSDDFCVVGAIGNYTSQLKDSLRLLKRAAASASRAGASRHVRMPVPIHGDNGDVRAEDDAHADGEGDVRAAGKGPHAVAGSFADTHPEVWYALAFTTHFAGDIHQPLHCNNRDLGGNTEDVSFYNYSTNLHHVWDTSMIYRKEDELGGMWALYEDLQHELATTYAPYIEEWRSCPGSSGEAGGDEAICPLTWAVESAGLACTDAWKGIYKDIDLGDAYYNPNIKVVYERLAMGGVRLAHMLNSIFT